MPKRFAGPLNSVVARWAANRWILGLIYATHLDALVGIHWDDWKSKICNVYRCHRPFMQWYYHIIKEMFQCNFSTIPKFSDPLGTNNTGNEVK